MKGKRGRGLSGKTIVLVSVSVMVRCYSKIVPNCSRSTLQLLSRGKWIKTVSFIQINGEPTMA